MKHSKKVQNYYLIYKLDHETNCFTQKETVNADSNRAKIPTDT